MLLLGSSGMVGCLSCSPESMFLLRQLRDEVQIKASCLVSGPPRRHIGWRRVRSLVGLQEGCVKLFNLCVLLREGESANGGPEAFAFLVARLVMQARIQFSWAG